MNDADLNAATVPQLVAMHAREWERASRCVGRGWVEESRLHRENAEAIAAEIERRCVR